VEEDYQANSSLPKTQAGVAILVSDKVDFKPKLERNLKKRSLHTKKKNNTSRKNNLYAPNVGAPNIIKQILLDLKTQIEPNTMVAGDFSL
jgi:hypothetical protein